jgi:tRNA threonylcarbamoyladenosine biosynthesis protein TsaB
MRILAIDTTSPHGSVALLDDVELIGLIARATDEPYSSSLFRDVENLLREAALELPAMDLYAVASGPGSFTGVRVGLAAVKGWAEVCGKPIAAVGALEAVAVQAPELAGLTRPSSDQSPAPVALIAAVTDANRGQFFAGLYESAQDGLRRRGEDVVMSPEDSLAYLVAQAGDREMIFCTTVPELVAIAVAASPLRGARIATASPVLAPFVGRLGYQRALRGELCDALSLEAHYVRRSDAELLWKQN